MNLDELRQSGNYEVPLTRQPISPASVINSGVEHRAHYSYQLAGFGVGIKIQVAAQIRPMIKRLDYRCPASGTFEHRTNVRQKAQGMVDPCLFLSCYLPQPRRLFRFTLDFQNGG